MTRPPLTYNGLAVQPLAWKDRIYAVADIEMASVDPERTALLILRLEATVRAKEEELKIAIDALLHLRNPLSVPQEHQARNSREISERTLRQVGRLSDVTEMTHAEVEASLAKDYQAVRDKVDKDLFGSLQARARGQEIGCIHPESSCREGPRVPLVYGSAATRVCDLCKAWVMYQHAPGKWRTDKPVEEAAAEDDDCFQ